MLATVRAGIRLGHVKPVDRGILERLRIADRDVDHQVGQELRGVLRRPVVAAGLEQQHLRLAVRAQPVGQHAAGAAGPDDDVVRLDDVVHPPTPVRPDDRRVCRSPDQ